MSEQKAFEVRWRIIKLEEELTKVYHDDYDKGVLMGQIKVYEEWERYLLNKAEATA